MARQLHLHHRATQGHPRQHHEAPRHGDFNGYGDDEDAPIRERCYVRRHVQFGRRRAASKDRTQDASFGPSPRVLGAVKPPGFLWNEFHTLKVEVGVARAWPKLDAKHLKELIPRNSYKLFSVVDNVLEDPAPHVITITPATLVALDARRLLALPANVGLPVGFNDPVVFPLHGVLHEVWLANNLGIPGPIPF
ncbi:Aste57867_16881 [Aphanomyces stellatus]|uniref:Aste57867_16881 protein n=1 Tax=Aphanomyces stellatus TaxID=120398 RepID=A0A485L6G4_9STRA|nr:hypothetical protein As57867_016823 [Aphanomyces stellatus]VFT93644.1 Aste57867_16881 [Aphanomyces stellatus]